MKLNTKTAMPCWRLVILLLFIFPVKSFAQNYQKKFQYKTDPVHYSFLLNFNEYSVLNGALVSGLTKYGGLLDYNLRMANEDNQIWWIFTIAEDKSLQRIFSYLEEKRIDWQQKVNEDSTNENKRSALNILQEVMGKLSESRNNPLSDLDVVEGVVEKQGESWFIRNGLGTFRVHGKIPGELPGYLQKKIVGYGILEASDQVELTRVIEKKENTLELFVMSLCPVAQQVETGILNFMETYKYGNKPKWSVHYIFYSGKNPELKDFTSLHGEPEIIENLVQIILRDRYPALFFKYLRKRLATKSASWQDILHELKASEISIAEISRMLISDRESLIEKEYFYVMGVHRIDDGSPTIVWESRKIKDITSIPVFKGISFPGSTGQGCSN